MLSDRDDALAIQKIGILQDDFLGLVECPGKLLPELRRLDLLRPLTASQILVNVCTAFP